MFRSWLIIRRLDVRRAVILLNDTWVSGLAEIGVEITEVMDRSD